MKHVFAALCLSFFSLFAASPGYAGFFDPAQQPSTFEIKNYTGRTITAVSLRGLVCFPNIGSTDPKVIGAATRRISSLYWKVKTRSQQKAALTVYGQCWAEEVIIWSNGQRVATLTNQLVSNIHTLVIRTKGRRAIIAVTKRHHQIDTKLDLEGV